MHGTLATAVLLGLSALASARPTGESYTSSSTSSSDGQEEFTFPLDNGFPNITNPSQALTDIEEQAHGTLPNGAAPPPPHPDSLNALGFIAFNELFEVAFFTELLYNITNNVPGFDKIPDRDNVLDIITVVQAQEELHELNANGAFTKFTGQTITPCEYVFPVDNFVDAIGLASTFTDVVLGTLPDIQTIFADNGDNGLIRGVGSVIGQEGEQNGFYRGLLGKIPSALPFLTGSAVDFAFNAINQGFVVPGSCDASIDLLIHPASGTPLTEFGVLTVLTSAADITSAQDSEVDFSFVVSSSGSQAGGHGGSAPQGYTKQESLFLTYINQQNVPISFPLQNEKFADGIVTFTASFPGQSQEMNGLTIAAVTTSDGPFATPDDVANVTLFGPGLIEVN
ncbi:hypothetical protein LTR36_002209 [Oleoguttula mirabilis]|uniref:Sexual development protein n=1 Tax=Oleoguttula mirabilis TaxID=1507867 RepID=A0AAV9JKP6_9PEZI|nr:hypothetical protein LTR36_002209 [Oleoguttula mirabilis]